MYWGAYESLRDRLLEERVQAARVRLEGKFAPAREAFSERYGSLGAQRDLVLSTITRVSEPDWLDHNEQVTCPACESQGWLGGEEVVDTKEDTVIVTPIVFL